MALGTMNYFYNYYMTYTLMYGKFGYDLARDVQCGVVTRLLIWENSQKSNFDIDL